MNRFVVASMEGRPCPISRHSVRVSPRHVVRALMLVTAALVAIHLVLVVLRFGFGHDVVFGLVRFFDLDRERNVPTYFSALLLGFAAALLWLAGAHLERQKDPFTRRWVILGWIFTVLSIDEIVGFHERLGRYLREATSLSHWVHFVWPVPATVLVFALYLAYRPWFASLDRTTRRGIIAAGFVYMAGAVGMEVVGGAYWAYVGEHTIDLTYVSITTVEETLEMIGMLLFIRALLGYIAPRGWGVAVAPDGPSTPSGPVRAGGSE